MFAIVTSKPGEFHTDVGSLTRVERYDYLLCGRIRACFSIVEVQGHEKVRIVEDSGSGAVNCVSVKFLPRFEDLQKAREELEQLVRFATLDAKLVRR